MIPLYNIKLSKSAINNVIHCLKSNWISSKGKFISKFEKNISEFIKVKNACAVSNGTVALHLALLSLGIKKDDEVIVPVLTYVAPVNAIKYVGAKPVFIDASIHNWNIDVNKIEQNITKKTKAIIAVHLFGFSCDIIKLKKLCKKYNLFLIEDVAEALGSTMKKKYLGSYGDISTFSFYGNKTLTTGEGGMLISNKKSLIDKAQHLKNQGMSKKNKYFHNVIGFNYRMTNICASIGCGELQTIKKILIKKKKNCKLISYEFKNKKFTISKKLEKLN